MAPYPFRIDPIKVLFQGSSCLPGAISGLSLDLGWHVGQERSPCGQKDEIPVKRTSTVTAQGLRLHQPLLLWLLILGKLHLQRGLCPTANLHLQSSEGTSSHEAIVGHDLKPDPGQNGGIL